jgi:ribonucleoside-diphosphate reductase alpha chain
MQFFKNLDEPDWGAFRHAVRLMTIALDLVVDLSSYPTRRHAEGSVMLRAIGLNHGNIGAVLMRNGIAYDSEVGRDWMAQITSFMTLEACRMSLELAEALDSYPAYNAADHKAILQKHRDAAHRLQGAMGAKISSGWDELCADVRLATRGLRNNTVTTIPPQGTIGLVLDQDTLGCEPEFCLVKHKTLSGGGGMTIVNQSVPAALERLGYNHRQIDKIVGYINKYGTAEGCDDLLAEHLAVFDTAVKPSNCLDAGAAAHMRTPSDLSEALAAISGALNPEQATEALPPHLQYLAPYVKVFTRSISIEGHVRALAALQPHLSHSISKTCNMDHSAAPEDISRTYRMAYDLGVKCIAIYRDGSKSAQPLSAGRKVEEPGYAFKGNGHKLTAAKATAPKNGWSAEAWPAVKRPTPHHTSNCDLFHFRIADPVEKQGLFINAALYPNSPDLMAIFVNTGRQGETTNGLVHSLARVISCALQHGVPAQEIGRKLAGMSFPPHGFLGETSAFGIHRAKSISDLIGRLLIALPDYYAAGRDAEIMHPVYETSLQSSLRQEALSNGFMENADDANGELDAAHARNLGYTGKPCQNCGSYETVGGAECYVCKTCGQSNGPCAG